MERAKNTIFVPYYCMENTFKCPFFDKICGPFKWQNCRSPPVIDIARHIHSLHRYHHWRTDTRGCGHR